MSLFICTCGEYHLKESMIREQRDIVVAASIKHLNRSKDRLARFSSDLDSEDTRALELQSAQVDLNKAQAGSIEERELAEELVRRLGLEDAYEIVVDQDDRSVI